MKNTAGSVILHYQLALEFDMNKLMWSNNLIQFDHPKEKHMESPVQHI